MKRIITAILLFLSLHGWAQQVKLSLEDRSGQRRNINGTWNLKERFSFEDGKNFIQINNNGVNKWQLAYTARYDKLKHALSISRVDEDGNELSINKLDNGERSFGPIPSASIEFDGKILLFYFKFMDKDSMKLFISEVDRSSLQLKNTQVLYSYSQKNSGLLGIIKESGREIILRLSPDRSKLLVVIPGYKEDIFACVFEKDLVISRKKALTVAGTEEFILNKAFVDDNGTGIIIFSDELYTAKSFNNTTVKKILTLSQTNTIKQIDVTSVGGETELNNVEFWISNDKSKIYLYGDYGGEIANAGIWLAEMSAATLKLGKARLIPYTEELTKNVYKIGFGERKRSNYGIRGTTYDLYEFENGDLAICGSPMAKDNRQYLDNGRTSGSVYFYSGPIIMAFLQGKNQAVFSMIPRHQIFCGASNLIFHPYKDKLVVLYSDYYKNLKEKFLPDDVWQKAGTSISNYCLAYAIVDKKGNLLSRNLLAEGVNRISYFNLYLAERLASNKYLIPSSKTDKKTGEQKVAIVTIEE